MPHVQIPREEYPFPRPFKELIKKCERHHTRAEMKLKIIEAVGSKGRKNL